ncbi:MAG TPA: S9 family peptidase [Chloroflexi bacterium]|nr:S9 family peptidase [Chloroflexota bacterium]HHW87923.1 S9 family peptidase [Chloroflexota bacterium]
MAPYPIQSLLSARLFVAPQRVGDRLYFISDMSGRLSLYTMRVGGSVPEPLIPPDVALPNPHHLEGAVVFRVLPALGKILLMLDRDGDENYQPVFIPIDGGLPDPVFGDRFAGQQLFCTACDAERNLALFTVDPRSAPEHSSFRVDLARLAVTELGASLYGNFPIAHNDEFSTILLADQYTFGDVVWYLWRQADGERRLLFGTPLDARAPDQTIAPNGLGAAALIDDVGVLFISALYNDAYGLTYFRLDAPERVQPVTVQGAVHKGTGELVDLRPRANGRYSLTYNIDGVSWVYAGSFDRANLVFRIDRVLVGQGELSDGVLEAMDYDAATGSSALSFSTATTPSQLYVLDADDTLQRQTNERVLGIPTQLLSRGEEYPYTAHDGLRISARLYLPAAELGYHGPRPVIFYIHGGPQSQERPDFTWFSMPLIQFLTLNGFAVWVPNVRGSSGYGISYMKRIDHDWGGLDRLDHITAFELLRQDDRLDMRRAGVMGRSYGGYMTLTLAGRHPELWRAAVDMFGPYNLFTFMERIPETWKTYFYMALGHPEKDRAFLIERSPSTYLHQLACPLLVIQGANDPRVVERESRDVVEQLRAQGKDVEYIVYADEGHDVLKYPNKVDCYSRITEFFKTHLNP